MTRRWWLPAALCLALVAGCGAGEPSPSGSGGGASTGPSGATTSPTGWWSPGPLRLTPADDGTTVTMAVGATSSLVTDTTAADPVVEGDAVLVVEMVNVVDSGMRQWEVRAERPGTSTITSTDPRYTITVVVE